MVIVVGVIPGADALLVEWGAGDDATEAAPVEDDDPAAGAGDRGLPP
jgi:hypothetical protein